MYKDKLNKDELVELVMSSYLGEEAVEAAQKENGYWEYRGVECGGDMIEDLHYCDDCRRWHKTYVDFGFRIEDGRLFVTDIIGDEGGDWDNEVSGEVQCEEDLLRLTHVDYDAIAARWKEYYQDVAETGDDHLGQLQIETTEEQTWIAYFTNEEVEGEKVVVLRSSCKIEPAKETILRGDDIPQEIKDFCFVVPNEGMLVMDKTLAKDVEELLMLVTKSKACLPIDDALGDGCLAIKIKSKMRLPDVDIKEETKKLARNQLV